jgi:hypothetical protein
VYVSINLFFFSSIRYFSSWFEDGKGEGEETGRETERTTEYVENDEEVGLKWV